MADIQSKLSFPDVEGPYLCYAYFIPS